MPRPNGNQCSGGARESVNWYVDANGDIWIADSSAGIREYIPQGLNGIGAPTYNISSGATSVERVWSAPSQFTELTRALYDPSSDTLFLAGYTTSNPRPTGDINGGTAGTQLFKYSNWIANNGRGSASWSVVLPSISRAVMCSVCTA